MRGQESSACQRFGVPFVGFNVDPLYSLRSIRGLRALFKLQRARISVRRNLRNDRPDVVFSTGGYSAGAVVAAARDLKIPYVLHTADSNPARSNRIFAREAAEFTCVFRSTAKFMPERKVVRTGQPIRAELRRASEVPRVAGPPTVLVLGGSQGSAFLNEAVPNALQGSDINVIHVAGKGHADGMRSAVSRANYRIEPYLDADALGEAFRAATLVVARSGGTIAEIAMFGLPSVLIPLPTSANDHQHHNAEEFSEMNAATLLRQSEADPERLASAIQSWIDDPDRREVARKALLDWDLPDATVKIADLVKTAGGAR